MPYDIEMSHRMSIEELDAIAGRSAWAEVDELAIAGNTSALQRIVGEHVAVMGLVKANGYGHGIVAAARAMLRGGASHLGVATVGEGLQLRAAGISAPILVLGISQRPAINAALRANLTLSVSAVETVFEVSQAAQALGCQATVHVKVDTGMHRLGLLPEQVVPFLQAVKDLPNLRWEGIYTHFATADELERLEVKLQHQRFLRVLEQVEELGWRFPIRHAANSAAAIWHPETRFDMVRAGIALYGVTPTELPLPGDFRPALSFHTSIVRIVDLPPGSPISYGGDYVTTAHQRIATLPVGYADGFRRGPPWREVLVRGQRVPVVGRICMDYAMVDVTGVAGVALGDEVTLLGTQGDNTIGAAEVASWLHTSAYEVLVTILPQGRRRVVAHAPQPATGETD